MITMIATIATIATIADNDRMDGRLGDGEEATSYQKDHLPLA